jgi:tight adherence protein B
MPAAIATFVLCITIIIGAYWVFVARPEENSARALRKRLHAEPVKGPQRTALTLKRPPLSALKALDSLLVRSGYVIQPIQRLIRLSGLPLTVGMVVLACGLVAMMTFLAAELASSPAWLALLLALLVAPLPFMCMQFVAKRRVRRLEELFPQAIDLIAVSLRAGHAFATGLLMVAEEVADPLGSEFRLVYDRQNYGKPLADVLKEFAERVPLLDVRIFVTAVLTQRETGGNLAEVLDKLSALIRERFKIRPQVRAVSAHGRITGLVLASLPPLVAVLLYLVSPDHVMILVRDPLGIRLVAAATVLQVAGTLAIRRIVNIEI